MESWLIKVKGKRIGPLSSEDVRKALRLGQIALTDEAAREGSELYLPIQNIDEIFIVKMSAGGSASLKTSDEQNELEKALSFDEPIASAEEAVETTTVIPPANNPPVSEVESSEQTKFLPQIKEALNKVETQKPSPAQSLEVDPNEKTQITFKSSVDNQSENNPPGSELTKVMENLTEKTQVVAGPKKAVDIETVPTHEMKPVGDLGSKKLSHQNLEEEKTQIVSESLLAVDGAKDEVGGLTEPAKDINAYMGQEESQRSSLVHNPKQYLVLDQEGHSLGLFTDEQILNLYRQKKIGSNGHVKILESNQLVSLMSFIETKSDFNGTGSKGRQVSRASYKQEFDTSYERSSNRRLWWFLFSLAALASVLFVSYTIYQKKQSIQQVERSTDEVEEAELSQVEVPFSDNSSKDSIFANSAQHSSASQRAAIEDASLINLSSLKKKAGKIVRLGPLTYSRLDLEKCKEKCSLIMQDKDKFRVKVVFFRDAYLAKLKEKAKNVFIEGRVSKSGKALYLSAVK